ncbi:MAG: glycosyltransferase [Cruoricaptor ignavus]|nr:glycosyltransferase [Cruoricaptor ignavus]
MKVLVSAFSSLYTDQRIEKVCETLHKNGFSIELIGNDWGGAGEMQRPYSFSRISLKSKSLRLAYPEFNWKLYKELKIKADKNTILLANDLDALLPNVMIAKKLNIPLVFDSHEIFTEMPAIQGRATQKIWRFLERKLMTSVKYMMTESFSYADWFQKKYGVNPIVVRNIPRKIASEIQFPTNEPKIILYQGAINQSRGIPQTIKAMHHVDNATFVIAGDGPKKTEYENLVEQEQLQNKVKFLGKLHPTELRKVTKTADVGISLEENGGVSYLYSLPNKVADYIQSRVPLVMINFPEMMRVYKDFKVGEIVENHEPEIIAEKLKLVLERGRNFYLPELDKAAQILCWEEEEPKILNLFNKVMQENFN